VLLTREGAETLLVPCLLQVFQHADVTSVYQESRRISVNSTRTLYISERDRSAATSDVIGRRGILSEKHFHRTVALERRRTERSHKPFLLMLIDEDEAIKVDGDRSGLDKILKVLSLTTRETDVVGWYKDSLVASVMFTEIDADDKGTIAERMLARVSTALQRNLSVEQFRPIRISFYWFPEEWQQLLSRKPPVTALYPDLANRDQARKVSHVVKRLMDISGSSLALIVAAPIFALVALAIKLTSKGPVFFRQQRAGRYGVPFSLLKFRSMHCGNSNAIHKQYVTQLISGTARKQPCDGDGQGVYKLTKDPRVTSVGAFLRRSSLDELPQLINVLKGEMSLVGPRPPLDYELEKYDLWHRRRLMEAKPGITGLWQVSGRNRIPFNEMVRLDLVYASSWSPWLDLKILFRTPRAVFAGAH
jgi:lipopolysaccharide/colanic/teichoic acid biosynthesis glycosyltransferase